jgi:hypothetical protein
MLFDGPLDACAPVPDPRQGVNESPDAAAQTKCNDRLLRLTYRSCEPHISGHVYDDLSDL